MMSIIRQNEIIKLAKKLRIDVVTTATDVCLEGIGAVVDEMNLHGTGLEIVWPASIKV